MTAELTSKTVWQVLGIIAALILAYAIRDVLILIFIALILAAVLEPAVQYLVNKRFPKTVAILVWYFIIIGLLTFIFAVMVPPITRQISQLNQFFPYRYTNNLNSWTTYSQPTATVNLLEQLTGFLRQWRDAAGSSGVNIVSGIFSLFGGFLSFVSVLVMTFYMLLERDGLKKLIICLTPILWREKALRLLQRMQDKMGLWVRGQLLLMLSIGVLTYVGLLILGVKYALVLALVAGLLEIVPIVGPITSAIPAVVTAFGQSPTKALMVFILYVVIQQAEGHILVPKIMSKSLGLSPVIVIIAILIGAKLGGITGTLLAVPAVTALSVLWEDRPTTI